MSFKEKIVMVSGAGGSIGREIAVRFSREGAKVFITDVNQEQLYASQKLITDQGGQCKVLPADITRHLEVKSVVRSSIDAYGDRIDILVNVAGIVGQSKVEDLKESQWDAMFAVNCKGSFFFVKEIVPLMKKHGYGRIINFSSKSGKTGSALMSHYSAAKAAIIGFTQSLAYELAGSGINVNCVCPGITEASGVWDQVSAGYTQNLNMPYEKVVETFTSKIPLKRLARVDDIAAVTVFLASEGADYMTGQAINITGGREMH